MNAIVYMMALALAPFDSGDHNMVICGVQM